MQLSSLLVTLVRHGESQDNAQAIWAGFRDTPLSSAGVNQAMALGQAFSNVPLTAIYSSDLRRAAMTAEEILQANRSIPPPPLVQSKSLRELNFGQAEGKSWAAAEWTSHAQAEDARTFRFPDGESLEDVNSRIAKAVRQFVLPRVEALRKQGPKTSTSSSTSAAEVPHICIVAHGIAIAELLRVFMSLHDQTPNSPWADPRLTYRRVRLENTGWSRLELAVPVVGPGGSRPSPQPTPTTPQAAGADARADARADGGGQATTSGDSLADGADGQHGDASRAALSASEVQASSKLTFVRILCQNQVEHLRAFAMQTPGSGAAHALGGGLPAGAAAATGSPTPSSVGQAGAGAASSGAGGSSTLPASATMASIASNATLSTSASNATLPPPSTPGAGLATSSGARSVNATPASARSLNAYDVKMMARELERAGAAQMLAGTESQGLSGGGVSGIGGAGSGSGGTTTSGGGHSGHPSTAGTPNPSTLSERAGMPHASSSLGALHAGQAGASGSMLFNPYIGGGASGSGIGMPAGSPNASAAGFLSASGATSDVWQSICVRVLPLFNGEGLRTSIEDLNELVSQHVRRTLDRGPARALDTLSYDLTSLAASGTLTLNSKLMGLDDVRLLVRLAEIWTFFLGQVLPYIQGCFLPFQTDPVLQSLASNMRATNAAAAQAATSPSMAGALRTDKINVRRILLAVFRDRVVLPLYERLSYLFSHISEVDPGFCSTDDAMAGEGSKQVYLRLLQMTSILASVVSDDEAQNHVDGLVRALRMGSKAAGKAKDGGGVGDFGLGVRSSSPTQQRSNRRGWMAQKARKHGVGSISDSLSLGSIAGGGSLTGTPLTLRSVPQTTINRFGQELSEDDYLTALRSPTLSTEPSTPGQPPPPPTPPAKDLAKDLDLSAHRRSEDSSRTAAPRTRSTQAVQCEGANPADHGRRLSDEGSTDDARPANGAEPSQMQLTRRGGSEGDADGQADGGAEELKDGAARANGDGGGSAATPAEDPSDMTRRQDAEARQHANNAPRSAGQSEQASSASATGGSAERNGAASIQQTER